MSSVPLAAVVEDTAAAKAKQTGDPMFITPGKFFFFFLLK